MRLRNALAPYIYTEARAFYDTAVAPVHPLYYEAPRDAAVYALPVAEREFMHGDRLLAAPITTMLGGAGGALDWPVYLPAGAWSNWNGTAVYAGGAQAPPLAYGAGDIPLFVRGGILPLKTMASVAADFPDPLVWALFPGAAAGGYLLYEDDGNSEAYSGGEFVTTAANFTRAGGAAPSAVALTIAPAQAGEALPPGFPAARAHVLQLRGAAASGAPAAVAVGGAPLAPKAPGAPGAGWYMATAHSLAEAAGSLVIETGAQSSWAPTTISVSW